MNMRQNFLKQLAVFLTLILVGLLSGCATTAEDKPQPPEVSFDGLQHVDDPDFDLVYKHPDADFSVYDEIMLMPVKVSFNKDWAKKYETPSRMRLSKSELDRIARQVANEFSNIFKEVLETEGGYKFADAADEDVLTIRPALMNIQVTALDVQTPGRSRTIVAESPEGQAVLAMELYDSLTGDILARSVDRQVVRDYGSFRYSTVSSVVNTDMARRAFRNWANVLKERFDALQK